MTRLRFSRSQFTRCTVAAALTLAPVLFAVPALAQTTITIPLTMLDSNGKPLLDSNGKPVPITSAQVQSDIGTTQGVTIQFLAGTYYGISIVPSTGDSLIGSGGVNSSTPTIFEGIVPPAPGGTGVPYPSSFIQSYGSVIKNVKLQDFVVQHYYPTSDTDNNDCAVWAGPGWVLADVCVDWCGVDGVNLYATAQMNGGEVKSCGHRGIGFSGTLPMKNDANYNGAIVNNVEIAYNNTKQTNETGSTADAGGLKGGAVDGIVVAFCSVHDNHGVGIWADVGCSGWFIHDNCVKNNDQDGIAYEISHNGSIYNNLVTFNGGTVGGAGQILIANSDNTNAYLNTVAAGPFQNAIYMRSDGNMSVLKLVNNGLNANNVTFNGNGGFYGLVTYYGNGNLGTGNYSNFNNFHLNQGTTLPYFNWGAYTSSAAGPTYLNSQAYQQTGEDPSSSFNLY